MKLPIFHIEKLLENAEATIDVPYKQAKYLKIAQDGLKEPMYKFLEDSNSDFMLFDFASFCVPSTASHSTFWWLISTYSSRVSGFHWTYVRIEQ